jgi:hypothetical protein
LDALSDEDAAQVMAGMKDVQKNGIEASKHLRGDIYEVVEDPQDAASLHRTRGNTPRRVAE